MVPETVSHYRILQSLGEGGMGKIYLAEDTLLGRKVAIKFLSGDLAKSGRGWKRLLREARAAAALDHPNICAIHEVVERESDSFIVMQYVEGETLDRKVARNPLSVADVLNFAPQIADALGEAHSLGIVHRDIKPQNLIITGKGQVKVLDFGLAKLLGATDVVASNAKTLSVLSDPGSVVGTMPYMSPEQLRAEELDGRSDIFSLGTVMYEMLTGNQPFLHASGAATISAVLAHEPPPLKRSVPSAPVELERIVHKCLEKNRDKRYQSARELAIDLRSLQQGLTSKTVTIETRSNSKKTAISFYATICAAIILFAGIGIYLWSSHRGAPISPTSISSVAVLPFANLSGDPAIEYLSDGITDSLIDELSQLPNVKVIGRSSVFRYKGRDADARAIGKELGVEAVLMGRIVERGEELSISTELVSARDNSHIWGAQYNRKVSDVLAVQDDISRVITEKLRLKINAAEQKRLNKLNSENPEVYQLYLKGRYFWNKRTEADLIRGIGYFQQAIDLDQNYAPAFAGLADSYALLGSGGYDTMLPGEAMPKAREAAVRALEIDEKLAEAHTSLAYVKLFYDWDWTAAEREFKRAIELNPNYATAHYWYSLYLMRMNNNEESIAQSLRAQELDPLSISINTNVGRALCIARKYDAAIEQLKKTLELDPDSIWPHYLTGLAYEQKGNYSQAIAEFQRVDTLSKSSPFSQAMLGRSYAVSGNRKEATRILAELTKQSKQKHISPYFIAIIYAGLDNKDQALVWLEKAYNERSNQLVYLDVEPIFDSFRSDPRFQNLSKRIGPQSLSRAST